MTDPRFQEEIRSLAEQLVPEAKRFEALRNHMAQSIVGQKRMIDRLLIGLLTRGHVLLEGVPGLAKTLAIKALAHSIHANFSRIQFTPDLLPADLTGTQVYNPKTQEFGIKRGPIFANFVLADEVNRAPAKVQSALLEAMQERQVTIGEHSFTLPNPFVVLATQNPIEQEGTYPLPEAQTDRFMLHVLVQYPTRQEEKRVMQLAGQKEIELPSPVLSVEDIDRAQKWVERIYVDDRLRDYILNLVWATREPPKEIQRLIEMGASPRASLAMERAGRAHAFLRARPAVLPDDIKSIASDVLRHRIKLSFEAEAENIKADMVIEKILAAVPIP